MISDGTPSGTRVSISPGAWEVEVSARTAGAIWLAPAGALALYAAIASLCLRPLDMLACWVAVLFWVLAIWFLWLAAMAIWGTVAVRMRAGKVTIFVGVGQVGLRRECDWASLVSIEERYCGFRNWAIAWGHRGDAIVLWGSLGTMTFGRTLSPRRRAFMVKVLRERLRGTIGDIPDP